MNYDDHLTYIGAAAMGRTRYDVYPRDQRESKLGWVEKNNSGRWRACDRDGSWLSTQVFRTRWEAARDAWPA